MDKPNKAQQQPLAKYFEKDDRVDKSSNLRNESNYLNGAAPADEIAADKMIRTPSNIGPKFKADVFHQVVELSSDSDDEPIAKKIKIDAKKVDTLIKEKSIKKQTNTILKKTASIKPSALKQINSSRHGHQSLTSIKGKLSALKSYLVQPPPTLSSPLTSKISQKSLTKMPTLVQNRTAIIWNEALTKAYQAVQNSKHLGSLMKSKPATSNSMPHLTKNLPSTSKVPLITAKPFNLAPHVKKLGANAVSLFQTKSKALPNRSTVSPQKSCPSTTVRPCNVLASPINRENIVRSNIVRLESRWKESIADTRKLKFYRDVATSVVNVLTRYELQNIKDQELRKDILMRYDAKIDRLKMVGMNDEQRNRYLKDKYTLQRQIRRAEMMIGNAKFDDREIENAKELPLPKIVSIPADCGFSPRDYGDALMIADFITGYADLLTPKDAFQINADSIIESLQMAESSGFELTSRLFVVYMETLIQSESPLELGTALDDVPVNIFTSAELVRLLCIPASSRCDDESDSGFDASSSFNETIIDQNLEKLSTCDFYTLPPGILLNIIVFLQNKLLQSPIFEDFLKEKEEELTEAWKEKADSWTDLKKYKSEALKISNINSNSASAKEPKVVAKSDICKSDPKASLNSEDNAKLSKSDDKSTEDRVSSPATTTDLSDVESMIFKVKNRRAMSQKEKEKRVEEERLEKERRMYEATLQSKENRVAAAAKKLAKMQDFFKCTFRCEPIGYDRNHNRYWFLPNTAPDKLYIEKVILALRHRMVQSKDWPVKFPDTSFTALEAKNELELESEWCFYDSQEDIEALLSTLLQRGIRESQLRLNLVKCKDKLLAAIERRCKEESQTTAKEEIKTKNKSDGVDVINSETEALIGDIKIKNAREKFREFIASELIGCEQKIRSGGLGGVEDFDAWKLQVQTAESISDLFQTPETFSLTEGNPQILSRDKRGHCLIEMRNSIRPSLLKGIMSSKKLKKEEHVEANDGQHEEQHRCLKTAAERKVEAHAKSWLSAISNCQTWSRLVVLYYILHSCIMWDKSVENAPCKVCRRRKDDDLTILCDECNECYHIYCLRPPLRRIPQGDWFCAKCRPKRTKELRLQGSDDDEEKKEETKRHDDVCTNCKSGASDDNPLMECSACPCVFHMDCHRPPLKHEPRSGWKCCVCTKGEVFRVMRSGKRR